MLKLEVIGNLTRDPELKTVGDKKVCNFTVAQSRRDRDGTEHTTYVRVGAWGRLGEICDQYLLKGRKVYVEGIPSARGYQTRDGQNAASLELLANNVEFLGGRSDAAPAEPPTPGQVDPQTGFEETDDEEMPF